MRYNYKIYTDEELISLVRKSDTKEIESLAFNEIYERYDSMIHAYCKCVLRNGEEAKDAFQETFIKFYYEIKRDKNIVNTAGLLISIARNLSLNKKRDKKHNVEIDEIEIGIYDNKLENKEMLELIMMSLEFLDEKYRSVFILRELDGLSYNEIGDQCSISADNAKQRNIRAKKQIIRILNPYLTDLKKNT